MGQWPLVLRAAVTLQCGNKGAAAKLATHRERQSWKAKGKAVWRSQTTHLHFPVDCIPTDLKTPITSKTQVCATAAVHNNHFWNTVVQCGGEEAGK